MARMLVALLLSGAMYPVAQAREVKSAATHGALAYHGASNSSGFAVDRRSSRDARIEALRQCAAPPLCFLCRWWPSAGAVMVSR